MSMLNPVSGEYMAFEIDEACTLGETSIIGNDVTAVDGSYDYPFGLVDFTANCGDPGFELEVKQYFYGASEEEYVIRKLINDVYITIEDAVVTYQEIGGENVLVVTYTVADGGELDADGEVNSVIVDPAGPALVAQDGPGAPTTGMKAENIVMLFIAISLGALVLVSQLIIALKAQYGSANQKKV